MKKKVLSLRKSRKVLKSCYNRFNKKNKKHHFSENVKNEIIATLSALQEAIQKKDKHKASILAYEINHLENKFFKKSSFEIFIDVFFSIVFALIIAIVIRQTWFEFYNIPTGSMRPTFKEQDFVIVSKTDFGINTLGRTSHYYFNPDLVKRGGCIVFSVANMDVQDSDTTYFLIFPGKKQFVKRLIAKPGDTLYFYGGQIYGIDKDGNYIEEYQNDHWFTQIEHIPFIRFNGNVSMPKKSINGIFTPVYIHQMGETVAKLYVNEYGKLDSEMYPSPPKYVKNANNFKNYFDLWGFKNFAMARILTKDQAKKWYHVADDNYSYYLELTHHPRIDDPELSYDEYHRLRPSLQYSTSILPLDNEHIKNIYKHMYTARFTIQNNKAARIGMGRGVFQYSHILPTLNIPDGTYEIDNGTAYKVYFSGISKKLDKNHPLNNLSQEQIVLLFNLGIEFNNNYAPQIKNQPLIPSRYAYFKDNSLYLLGHEIFTSNNPILSNFIEKQASHPYPFIDNGSPFINRSINKELIKRFGITLPDNMYLALGDNHAMSGDSRDFGFVPQSNLRGGPAFIFWPPGHRWGFIPQPYYNFFTFPNLFIWSIFLLIVIISLIFTKIYSKKPLKF